MNFFSNVLNDFESDESFENWTAYRETDYLLDCYHRGLAPLNSPIATKPATQAEYDLFFAERDELV